MECSLFSFLKIWGVVILFFKNLGCRDCRGQTILTNFSQTFPKYHPPEKFLGTLRREEKILGERCVV